MSGNLQTIVGVDEAGYGPRLGPLVVALSAFRLPASAPDLRSVLHLPAGAPVDDSKRLYHRKRGLGVLERSVLAFRAVAAEARVPDPPRDVPVWAPEHPPRLPVAAEEEAVAATREELAAALEAAGVEVLALQTRTVGVQEFNRGVLEHGSKAEVLFDAVAELLDPWLRREGPTRIHVDRHGGRAYYSRLLGDRFPDLFHLVRKEGRRRSSYVFPGEDGGKEIAFEVNADSHHLSTALASMAAKYVRELHMHALNRYFGAADPNLLPTAGYAADARRWLEESEALRVRLGVADGELIRIR